MTRVFIHGFALGPSMWDEIAGRDDLRLTVPGHGNRDCASSEFETSIAPLLAEIPEGAHLIGYSMGGRIALSLALHPRSKVSRLTLISANPGLADDQQRSERAARDSELADALRRRGVEWFADHWQSLPMWSSQGSVAPHRLQEQRRLRCCHRADALATAVQVLGPASMPNYWGQLHAVTVPTDVVVGRLDDKYSELGQAMAKLMPNAVLHSLAGAGHNPVLEAPALIARIVDCPREAAA